MEEREKDCEGSYPSVSSMAAPDAPPLTRLQSKQNGLWKKCDSLATSSSPALSCIWNRLFDEGYRADVCVYTDDGPAIHAHASVLGIASPVLKSMLKKSRGHPKSIAIPGVPHRAVRAFLHYLYVPCCDEREMEEFASQLLVLSHAYVVPSLKRECTRRFENGLLNVDNAIDIFQLAYYCDAPRLHLISHRMIIKRFKEVSATEGWRAMQESEPLLEKELLESLVEADTIIQQRLKRIEEKKIYQRLWEAMEALVHICRDGCKTIGPYDQVVKVEDEQCKFAACKGLENLIRHFAGCKARAAGCCGRCKRMWQLLELHSRICVEEDVCKVPLCRYFQKKLQHQSKKEETKWKLLVKRLLAVKNGAIILPFRSTIALLP